MLPSPIIARLIAALTFAIPASSWAEAASGLHDPVTALRDALAARETSIAQSDEKTFLTDTLDQLGVPVETQVLVFSKTSQQNSHISPSRPRALYFSDNVYVGWVQGGMVEVISHDPDVGTMFSVIERQPDRRTPHIAHSENCLSCHEGSRTRNVPGVLVRSLYTSETGHPILAAGTFLTDHSSPFEERWGGWYVTGQHGDARHMGNTLATWVEDENRADLDRDVGANLSSLDKLINTTPYLRDDSDIVALMVLEHQVGMLNRIVEADQYFSNSLRTSASLYPQLATATTEAGLTGSALSVAQSYANRVVRYMLFSDEAAFPDGGVEGRTDFLDAFQTGCPTTERGASLKDFHLLSRLFKNRCSYMIYSDAFASLHPALKDTIYHRLWDALSTAPDPTNEEATAKHLSLAERRRIIEILRETVTDLPAVWE